MKIVDNYFKTPNGVIFFDSLDREDTGRAFARARALARGDLNKVSIFKVPYVAGTWDRLALVGHRRKRDIEKDLGEFLEPGVRTGGDDLEDPGPTPDVEMKALEEAYRDAGRFCAPVDVVAA